MSDPAGFEKVLDLLLRHGVRFIVIGGQAESIMGSPRLTYDADLCYQRTADNLERLASALQEINPTLRGAPPDLPFGLMRSRWRWAETLRLIRRLSRWTC